VDILEIEDVLKGLPDQSLMQEAKQPTGQVPQYMVVSEIQRRSKMRKSFEAQKKQPSSTITEQILTGGVASVAPPPPQMMGAMGMPQQPPAPPQQPPMGQQQPPMQPQQMPPQQPPMPQQGALMPQQGAPMPPPMQMAGGGLTVGGAGIEDSIRTVLVDYGIPADVLKLDPKFSQYASLIDKVSADMMSGVQVYDAAKAKADIPYGQEFEPVGPMPTEISPFGTYSATTERTMPRIGDVKASDIYGDVSLPSLPDLPMVGTTPELQRQRAREEIGGIGAVAGSTPEEFEAVRGRLLPTEEERTAMQQERIRANLQQSRGFDATAGSMTLGEAIESGQVLSPEIKGLVGGAVDSVKGVFRDMRQPALDDIRQKYISGTPLSQNEMSMYNQYGPGMEALDGLFGSGVGGSQAITLDNPYNTGVDYSNIPGPQMAGVVVNPKDSSAVIADATTGQRKIDPEELNLGLSEKTTEFAVGEDLAKSVRDITGGIGESPIQTQGIKYTTPELPDLIAPDFATLISEQERRIGKIKEDAKRDVGAQALINLGAGIAEGDVSGGLVRAGQAVSKIRAGERAAESEISNLQTRIKMAEEQGKFDTAKALRADAVKASQFESTMGFKQSELNQTLKIAEDRIKAEGDTEKGRALRAKYTALLDYVSRLQSEPGVPKESTLRNIQSALSQLEGLLGIYSSDTKVSPDTSGFRVVGTEG
jgi:hypothetical protein